MESSDGLDPRFLELVDHVLEADNRKLVSVNYAHVREWLTVSGDGLIPSDEMIRRDVQRRLELCRGITNNIYT